jgi:hypothetical protein
VSSSRACSSFALSVANARSSFAISRPACLSSAQTAQLAGAIRKLPSGIYSHATQSRGELYDKAARPPATKSMSRLMLEVLK